MRDNVRLWFYVMLAFGLVRCSDVHNATDTSLIGVVRTEGIDSKLIGQANIRASNMSSPIVTGLDGRFALPQSKVGESITVQVTANGYAPQTRYVSGSGAGRDVLNISLRPLQSRELVMPSAGEPAASFTVSVLDGSATVSIPPDSLVDSDGRIAQGNVIVNMAYWSYFDHQSSGPLPLLAQAANPCDTPIRLTTYGMADISVTQNGAELRVAPEHTLGLTFAIPSQQKELVKNLVAGGVLAPRFYSGDQNKGLWIEEGNLQDGTLVFDANAVTMTGQMAHLSTWNLDNSFSDNGGCVSGTIVGADGVTPTANQSVQVYFLSRDEVTSFTAKTDANGSYCINTGVNVKATTVSYYVASAADIKQSNMCNAMPSYCSDCDSNGSWNDPNNNAKFCSFCVLRNDAICTDPENGDINGQNQNLGCNPRPVCDRYSTYSDLTNNCAVGATKPAGSPLLGYIDSCTPKIPAVQIDMCHFCPGTPLPASCTFVDIRHNNAVKDGGTPVSGGCGNLGITSFVPGVTVPNVGVKPVCDPSLPTTKYYGQACAQGVDSCCPVTASLTCEDLICVPSKDDGTNN